MGVDNKNIQNILNPLRNKIINDLLIFFDHVSCETLFVPFGFVQFYVCQTNTT